MKTKDVSYKSNFDERSEPEGSGMTSLSELNVCPEDIWACLKLFDSMLMDRYLPNQHLLVHYVKDPVLQSVPISIKIVERCKDDKL